jgi:hypothetical protein
VVGAVRLEGTGFRPDHRPAREYKRTSQGSERFSSLEHLVARDKQHLEVNDQSVSAAHAAEQRDEVASFQLIELHSIPASQNRVAG